VRQKIENYFTKLWYHKEKAPMVLLGLSKIFNTQRKRREQKLKKRWNTDNCLSVPVLIVGNLTVGGTGKTPIVQFLIKNLREYGFTVGVISRGYGGSIGAKPYKILDEHSTAAEVGDEAFMLYKLSSIPFAVGPKRHAVAQALLKQHPEIDLIISDDGLQHYYLQRDVEIVIVDGERGFGNAQLLPAGPLREPLSRLESVDLVLVNGLANHASLKALNLLKFELKSKSLKRLNSSGEVCELQKFYGQTVHAFAGIGNPERFFRLLESMGLDVIRHSLADHARMPMSFFTEHKNDIVVMTEKDAVKYPTVFAENFWYLPVEAKFSSDTHNTVLQVISDKLKEFNNGL